jgi:REP element-mobilizing transposase RayT
MVQGPGDVQKARLVGAVGKDVRAVESPHQCAVYAWVLLDNHAHLLFKSGTDSISTVMRKQLTWYAQYYNRRHRRRGYVFENRYKSILCEEDTSSRCNVNQNTCHSHLLDLLRTASADLLRGPPEDPISLSPEVA